MRPHSRVDEIRALAAQGLTRTEIGERLGIRYNTVKGLCTLHGIAPPRARDDGGLLVRIIELAPHHTRSEIAGITGASYSSVRNFCLRHGIKPISRRFFDDDPMRLETGRLPAMRYQDAAVPPEIGRFIPAASDGRFRTTAAVAVDHPMAGVGI